MTAVLWTTPAPADDVPLVHALVIGVSAYDHLDGGPGPRTDEPLLAGLSQLSAAATSASRVAVWLRDRFDFPSARLGSVRLLASPSSGELPLPGGVTPPPATYDEVGRAVAGWRRDARSRPDNVTLLYVAGHGIQTSNEGGILLLQDVGAPDSLSVLQHAVDVSSLRRGMVADPAKAATATPAVQYYFYDACRVVPPATDAYAVLTAGISLDEPKGVAAAMSFVIWGSRSRDYALADAGTKTTLFSKAFTEALESGAPADPDGRTVRFAQFDMALEAAVEQLADQFGELQEVLPGGTGKLTTPVYLRPALGMQAPPVGAGAGGGGGGGGGGVAAADDAGGVDDADEVGAAAGEGADDERAAGEAAAGGDGGEPPDVEAVPVPPNAARRQVVVEADDGQRLALTLTDATGAVVAEGVTGEPVEVPTGDLRATIQRPWGGTVVADIAEAEAAGAGPITVHVAQQSVRNVADSPRLNRQLGPAGGARSGWALRFLTWTPSGLVRLEGVTPPGVEVDDVEEDDVAIIMHAHGSQLQYAQIRTDDGRSLVVALPILMAAELETACWLHVRVSGDALGAVVRFFDQQKDAVAGYLLGGRPDHAASLASSAATFESMLESKMRDPIGAVLGGYALLRLNELDRMHDWPVNLANMFDWLPDGAVIAGELAARRGDDVAAAEWFRLACARGLPLFGEGLSLLSNRVPQLVADVDVPTSAQGDLREAAKPLLALSPTADFRALASTLHAELDRGEISASNGWKRFGRTGPVRDPSDFWSDPVPETVFALHVLPAGIGDALVLEYGTPGSVNRVLIDGGVSSTSERLAETLGPDPGLELMMVTHIDNDHLCGLLKVLESGAVAPTFGDVWFNGFRHLPESPLESMGPVEGERLTTYLVDHAVPWNSAAGGHAVMVPPTGMPERLELPGGLGLRILSPGHDQLVELRKKWLTVVREAGLDPQLPVVEQPLAPAGRLQRMGAVDVAALAAAVTKPDDSVSNGASIAVLADWAGRTCLLTGDAHAEVLLEALDRWLGPGSTLDVDVFKLPHHGSKANVTDELMRRVRARVYVFSSSGEGNSRHPNDQAVARAIVHAPPGATLAFNYRTARTEPWGDEALRTAHDYQTLYPATDDGGLTIDLTGLSG